MLIFLRDVDLTSLSVCKLDRCDCNHAHHVAHWSLDTHFVLLDIRQSKDKLFG